MSISRDFIDPYSPEAPQHRGLQSARLLNHAITTECDRTTLVFGFRYKLHWAGTLACASTSRVPARAGCCRLGQLVWPIADPSEIGSCRECRLPRAQLTAVLTPAVTR